MIAAGDKGFAAVDDDMVSIRRKARLHAGRVGAGGGFCDAKGDQAAFGDFRQQPGFLRMGGKIDYGLDRVKGGTPDQCGGGTSLGHFADCCQIPHIGGLGAAIFVGNEHTVQAQFVNRMHVVPGEFAAAVIVRRPGRQLIPAQGTNGVQQ